MHSPARIKAALAEADVDISGQRSKLVNEFRGVEFDRVVTVCDTAGALSENVRYLTESLKHRQDALRKFNANLCGFSVQPCSAQIAYPTLLKRLLRQTVNGHLRYVVHFLICRSLT